MSSSSIPSRYERGYQWRRKGYFWLAANLIFMAFVLATPVYLAQNGSTAYWVLFVVKFALLAAQLACLARMVFCYRRARRIWDGKS